MSSNQTSSKQTKKNKTKDKNKSDKKSNSNKIVMQQTEEMKAQKIRNYFTQISGKHEEQILEKARYMNMLQIDQIITKDIEKGIFQIPENSKRIDMLLKPEVVQIKITQAQMQMYQKQAKRIEHLKLISNLNKQLQNKQPQQAIPYILTKQDHERKVREIVEQKKNREQKIQEIKVLLRQRQQLQQKQETQLKQLSQQKMRQQKRARIQQSITKQKQNHIHFLSQQIKQRHNFEELMSKTPLFIKMQQKFKEQVEIPQEEQKHAKYRNWQNFKRSYSIDSIKKHQEDYLTRRTEKSSVSKLSSRISHDFMPNIPEKSSHLQRLLAEQILQMKTRWTQRDRYIEQKQKREQNYLKKLKESHKPIVDISKRSQFEQRLIHEKQHLSKIGLDRDPKKLGLEYLWDSKKVLKKQRAISESTLNTHHSQTLLRPLQSRVRNQQKVQLLQKLKQKAVDKILMSGDDRDHKLNRLKIEEQKIQQAKNRKMGLLNVNFDDKTSKQASNLAINSLKAKIGLMELMRRH